MQREPYSVLLDASIIGDRVFIIQLGEAKPVGVIREAAAQYCIPTARAVLNAS